LRFAVTVDEVYMPRMAIRTDVIGPDGQEIVLSEYLCDWPDCANIAEEVVGVVLELRRAFVVCREHAATLQQRSPESSAS
jgi:hypothetical protein